MVGNVFVGLGNPFVCLDKKDEGDRVLLFGATRRCHIIATPEDGAKVRLGDLVWWEPSGWNFGWYLRHE